MSTEVAQARWCSSRPGTVRGSGPCEQAQCHGKAATSCPATTLASLTEQSKCPMISLQTCWLSFWSTLKEKTWRFGKKKNVFFVTPVQLFWHTSWTVFNTLTDCKSRSISCQSNHSRLGSFTNSAAKPAFGLRLPWPRLSLPPEILLIPFILSPF